MASYGSGVYGYSAYGLFVEPIASNIGGLIRFSDDGDTPMLIRIPTEDGVQLFRTTLTDEALQALRAQPEEFEAVIRVETAFDLSAERTELETQVLNIQRTFSEGTIATVRHEGEGELTIEPNG